MIVMGLDLSTKTGWSALQGGSLIAYGLVEALPSFEKNDYSLIRKAKSVAIQVASLIDKYNPDCIYIEQTNAGSNREAQKQLEFIHYAILDSIECYKDKIRYIDTSRWRSLLKLVMNKDQKKHNADRRKLGDDAGKCDGVKGLITAKHLAVLYVNQEFNLTLKIKDNDIADAICLAAAGYKQESSLKPQKEINIGDIFNV
jgi:Holliday junction resolvasome RuvABC endonuclease subunit